MNKKGDKAKSLSDYRRVNARIVNSKRFPDSGVYLMGMPNLNLYKIGVSNNVSRRHHDITSASPFDVELIKYGKVPNAYLIEAQIHNLFQFAYIKSEWFYLNTCDVSDIIDIIEYQSEIGKTEPQLTLF